MSSPASAATGRGHDIVVVGAGVIGLACAWRLSQRGLSVALIDSGAAGGESSHVAAGMLAPITEVEFGEAALMNLNLASANAYPDFVEELQAASGLQLFFREGGSLCVAADRDEAADVQRLHDLQRTMGLSADWLDGRACRETEPGLAPAIQGGVLAASDAQIDPRALTAALLKVVKEAGVTVAEHTSVTEVAPDGDRCTGVRTDDGAVWPADSVVVATGCWTGSEDWIPEAVRPPVRPVKGQLLRLKTRSGEQFCEHIIRTPSIYVVSHADGRVVLGASSEEQGFDRATTAGAMLELLRDAYLVLPDLAELELVEMQAGLRPGTPDNAPILGKSSLSGLTFATGHYRNGILLAPITAQLIAADLAGDATSIEDFSPTRFQQTLEPAR